MILNLSSHQKIYFAVLVIAIILIVNINFELLNVNQIKRWKYFLRHNSQCLEISSSKTVITGTKAPPVVVQPIGGLGNQLFRYAAAYSLANRRNSDLYLCLTCDWESSINYENLLHFDATDRSYMLWAFNISHDNIVFHELDCENMLSVSETHSVNEKEILRSNILIDKTVKLSGDFESAIFFETCKKEIFRQFTFQPSISEKIRDKLNIFASIISSTESVAVHVRKGDFTGEKRLIPSSYYKLAINRMKNEIDKNNVPNNNITFFVFSDDIDKVKEDFENLSENFVFVSNKELSRLADFMLMVMCNHIIIGNSTFSWWAAYLNSSNNKTVIAPLPKFPTEWYERKHFEKLYTEIYGGNLTYPKEWITIDPFQR